MNPLPANAASRSSRATLKGMRRAVLSVLGLLLVVGLSEMSALRAQTSTQAEYEIKAALLYKLLGYVEWPNASALPADAPFIIGILGQDPAGKAQSVLTAILSNKTVKGRNVAVRPLASPAEIAGCQIVFVTAAERDRLPEILDAARGKPVLTVGEMPGFAEHGGHINLPVAGNTVGLEINAGTAVSSGLTISAQLLKLKLVKMVKS